MGVDAVALRDWGIKLLAGEVVDAKGPRPQHTVSQVLRDLRKIGHHDKVLIKTDQEAATLEQFQTVAKARGVSQTFLETAVRSDSQGVWKPNGLVSLLSQWCAHS